jgi:hypothetical protein
MLVVSKSFKDKPRAERPRKNQMPVINTFIKLQKEST